MINKKNLFLFTLLALMQSVHPYYNPYPYKIENPWIIKVQVSRNEKEFFDKAEKESIKGYKNTIAQSYNAVFILTMMTCLIGPFLSMSIIANTNTDPWQANRKKRQAWEDNLKKHLKKIPPASEEIDRLKNISIPSALQKKVSDIFTKETQKLFTDSNLHSVVSRGTLLALSQFKDKTLEKFIQQNSWALAQLQNLKNKGFHFFPGADTIVVSHKDLPGWIMKIPNQNKATWRPGNFSRLPFREELYKIIKKFNLSIKVPKKYPFCINSTAEKGLIVLAEELEGANVSSLNRRQFNDFACLVKKTGFWDIQPGNIRQLEDGTIAIIDTEDFRRKIPTEVLTERGLDILKESSPENTEYKLYEIGHYRYWEAKNYIIASAIACAGIVTTQHLYKVFKIIFKINKWQEKLTESISKIEDPTYEICMEHALNIVSEAPNDIKNEIAAALTRHYINEVIGKKIWQQSKSYNTVEQRRISEDKNLDFLWILHLMLTKESWIIRSASATLSAASKVVGKIKTLAKYCVPSRRNSKMEATTLN